MIRSGVEPRALWSTIALLALVVGASVAGLRTSTRDATPFVTSLFYVFMGLSALSFFFVLRHPRRR
jgi:hypothetical protein